MVMIEVDCTECREPVKLVAADEVAVIGVLCYSCRINRNKCKTCGSIINRSQNGKQKEK